MKQKHQVALLAVLLIIAGVVWYFARNDDANLGGVLMVAQKYTPIEIESQGLHLDSLDRARKTEYKSAGRNIFSAIAPPPPAPKKDKPAPQPREVPGPKQPPPTPPPPPPTLPAKFFGYGTSPSGIGRRAFLLDGEDVYIVAEGEVFLNRFRILSVGNASLEFEELSSGRRGKAPLEEQAVGSGQAAGIGQATGQTVAGPTT